MKICTACQVNKPLSAFRPDERYRYGVAGHCTECRNQSVRLRYEKVKLLPKPDAGTKHCPSCKTDKSIFEFSRSAGKLDGRKSHCKTCTARNLNGISYRLDPRRALQMRLRNYGMTEADFSRMIDSQSGKCGCCNEPIRRPVIDHDHSTGLVRRLVCFRCNSWISVVEHPTFVGLATRYLSECKIAPTTFKVCEKRSARNKQTRDKRKSISHA